VLDGDYNINTIGELGHMPLHTSSTGGGTMVEG
jgi:hypothetical protein